MHTTKIKSTSLATDTATMSDEEVIELLRSGSTQVYETIMRRYNQRLFRTARSILLDNDAAQDAVQQAYISAYYKLDTYKSGGSFGAWLCRITINEALMIQRKPDNRNAAKNDTLDGNHISSSSSNPDTHMANTELATLIETAIDQLPGEYRSVFVLRAIQQLNTKETAESLTLNEATVKTRFHRARNLMQITLNQHIEQAGMQVFEFAGNRCDAIVDLVLGQISEDR